MYWSKQEQFIFDIVLFVLVAFQISTFFILKTEPSNLQYGLVLAGLNLLFLAAMIPYAKWVWKTLSFHRAILQVVKHEIILLGLIVGGILLAMLLRNMKIHT